MKFRALNKAILIYYSIFIILICIAIVRYTITRMGDRKEFIPVVAIGRVTGLPQDKNNDNRYPISITHLLSTDPQITNLQYQSNVKLVTNQVLRYGDIISINGFLTKYNSITNAKVNNIDYQPDALTNAAFQFRSVVEQRLYKILPSDHANLALGMTIGTNASFQSTTEEALKKTSVMHMVVVSGYNINILVSLVLSLAGYVGRKKLIILTICTVSTFVIMTGAEPPTIRAAIMASIVLIAQLFGRKTNVSYAFIISILCFITVSPQIIHNLSFQLSVLATSGILYIKPSLQYICTVIKLPTAIKDEFLTTIAAQIAVAPLIASSFGTFSVIGIIANILVAWTVPYIMIGTVLLFLLSFCVSIITKIGVFLLIPFTAFFLQINTWLAQLPYSQISDIKISSEQIVVIYIVIALLTIIINSKKSTQNNVDTNNLKKV